MKKNFREKMKLFLAKAVSPGTGVVLGSIPVSLFLLGCIYGFGYKDYFITYIVYGFSFYTLAIFCVWIPQTGKKAVLSAEKILRRNRVIDRCFSDTAFRSLVFLYLSATANIVYMVLKLYMGVTLHSVWLVALAVYYGFLFFMRILLLRKVGADSFGKNLLLEFKRYRHCAVILLLMNISLVGMIMLFIYRDERFQYGSVLIYAVALYDFCIIIMAAVNLYKARNHESPILAAARVVSFAAALTAMLFLETAMFSQFDTVGDMVLQKSMIAATGGTVSVIFVVMASYMLIRSTREINKIKDVERGRDETKIEPDGKQTVFINSQTKMR